MQVRGSLAIRIGSLFLLVLAGSCRTSSYADTEAVGQVGPQRYVTPVHQVLTPVGLQVELAGLRPQGLALSPDGRLLATSGKTAEVVLLDPQSGTIRQRVALPSDKPKDPNVASPRIVDPNKLGQLSYTGLLFSPDGSRLYLSNVNGAVEVFGVDAQGQVSGLSSIALPAANAPRRKPEIPAGLALSRDGRRLYVALNLSNRLAEIDPAAGKVLRSWPVGFAPYGVVLVGDKAYVSNWGGRVPDANSVTGPAGKGTKVRVDPVRYIANEGSVSVIHLDQEAPVGQIMVGLHSSALVATPDGRHVVVANAGSDTLSVIDTRTDQVVETIWVKSSPADLFGASPNALAFDPAGDTLYVANGTQNAIAVVHFQPGKSKLLGLIPVGWFPGAVEYDAPRRQLLVANIKGVGSNRGLKPARAQESNTHQYHGSSVPRACPQGQGAAGPDAPGARQLPLPAAAGSPTAGPAKPAAASHPGKGRRAVRLRARGLHHQGEPHLRPGPGGRPRRQRQVRPCASSGPTSRPTSIRWSGNSSCWTTPTVPAFAAPTATNGRIPRSPRTTWSDPSRAFPAAIPTARPKTAWMPWRILPPGSSGTTPSPTASRSAITASS